MAESEFSEKEKEFESWFKKNWGIVLLIVGGIVALFLFLPMIWNWVSGLLAGNPSQTGTASLGGSGSASSPTSSTTSASSPALAKIIDLSKSLAGDVTILKDELQKVTNSSAAEQTKLTNQINGIQSELNHLGHTPTTSRPTAVSTSAPHFAVTVNQAGNTASTAGSNIQLHSMGNNLGTVVANTAHTITQEPAKVFTSVVNSAGNTATVAGTHIALHSTGYPAVTRAQLSTSKPPSTAFGGHQVVKNPTITRKVSQSPKVTSYPGGFHWTQF